MQVSAPQTAPVGPSLSRKIGYFLLPPLVVLAVVTLIIAVVVGQYQATHHGRVLTGVQVGEVDLSGMTAEEAEAALTAAYPYTSSGQLAFVDPVSGGSWTRAPEEMGVALDSEGTLGAAMEVGRSGGPFRRLQEMFGSWYYGRQLAPVFVFDEGQMERALSELAAEVDEPAVDAAIAYQDGAVVYESGRPGRELDTADLRQRLLMPLTGLRDAEVELLVHEISPALFDDAEMAAQLEQILSEPVTFYLAEPLDDGDLQPVTLSTETLATWLRIEAVEQADGSVTREMIVDENAFRHWLRDFEDAIAREPVNARFYFDDDTRELVLVAPHVNGRVLNLDATLEQFRAELLAGNHTVPFVVDPITPVVNAGATATELGITELITETRTWFSGSSDERKHNIARAAANFFGIVIAPGEEFSFNKYLGTISEADGYEEGLIIVGGQTIKGIGGGVCQVSTTLYQAAFLAGFPITERWAHGYWLRYYNDGEGPGMDATVYSPIVDMKFINNTPHHLLIENYYNEEFESLTFKFYSTSMGRVVEKTGPVFENVTEVPGPEQDRWEFDPDLEPGTVQQIDWATEGADVYVGRTVYNADGEIILEETVVSNYIPFPNTFHYGPGVEPYDYSLVPPDPYN